MPTAQSSQQDVGQEDFRLQYGQFKEKVEDWLQ